MRVVVDEHEPAALVDNVKKRVPREQDDDVPRHGVGHEHLAGRDHVGAGIDRRANGRELWEPRLERIKHHADPDARKPREKQHHEDACKIVDRHVIDRDVVDVDHDEHRQDLDVERAQRIRQDRHEGRHRRVLHHGRGGTIGPHDRTHRLGLRHVKEDAGHDVEQEIAPDHRAAQAEHGIHHVEHRDQHHGLEHVDEQPHERIGMRLAQIVDGRVIDQLEKADDHGQSAGSGVYSEHLASCGLPANCRLEILLFP